MSPMEKTQDNIQPFQSPGLVKPHYSPTLISHGTQTGIWFLMLWVIGGESIKLDLSVLPVQSNIKATFLGYRWRGWFSGFYGSNDRTGKLSQSSK